MQQYYLEKATINDSGFFYQVKKTVLKSYIEQIWGWDEDFQIQFHQQNFHVDETCIIKINEIAVGTVEIKEDEYKIFISSLYLLPQYQNKGIGSSIIQQLIAKATKENKRVELEVLKINTEAQKLYKKLGFVLTERDDTKYFMYKDCSK
jgi:ribosomal protein S18 acetylase RimI-like enzyme